MKITNLILSLLVVYNSACAMEQISLKQDNEQESKQQGDVIKIFDLLSLKEVCLAIVARLMYSEKKIQKLPADLIESLVNKRKKIIHDHSMYTYILKHSAYALGVAFKEIEQSMGNYQGSFDLRFWAWNSTLLDMVFKRCAHEFDENTKNMLSNELDQFFLKGMGDSNKIHADMINKILTAHNRDIVAIADKPKVEHILLFDKLAAAQEKKEQVLLTKEEEKVLNKLPENARAILKQFISKPSRVQRMVKKLNTLNLFAKKK